MITAEVREVKLVSPQVNLSNIPSPKAFPWLSFSFADPQGVFQQIAQQAPVEQDIVDWMRYAALFSAYAQVTTQSYNSIGYELWGRLPEGYQYAPQLLSAAGDGFIPGVWLPTGVYFVSQWGFQVKQQGYALLDTPVGQYKVPYGGSTLVAQKDVLVWAAVPYSYEPGPYTYYWPPNWRSWYTGPIVLRQFLGVIFQWLKLAKVPFQQKVTFPTAAWITGPQFFDVKPSVPVPALLIVIGVESPSEQEVTVAGIGPSGSYQDQYFSRKVKLQQGQQDIYLVVSGFPAVSEFTLEVWPQDSSTAIDYIKTVPPI